MAHVALIYAEPGQPAYMLGTVTYNGSLSKDDLLDLIGMLDTETVRDFVQMQGWDGFDYDMVRAVAIGDEPDLERGEEVPTYRIILDTTEGPRYIETPDLGEDIWNDIALYDEINGTHIWDEYNDDHVWPDDGTVQASPYDGGAADGSDA